MEKISDHCIQRGVESLAGLYIPLTLHRSGPDGPLPERVSFSDGVFRFSAGPDTRPHRSRRRILLWVLAFLGAELVLLPLGANPGVVAFSSITIIAAAVAFLPGSPEPVTVVIPEFAPGILLVEQGSGARIRPDQLLAGAAAADPLAAWEAATILAKGDATTTEAREEAALLLFRLYNQNIDNVAAQAALEGASDLGRLSVYNDQS